MRVSIIAADNKVYIDGAPHDCDTSRLLQEGIHAVQWYGDGYGEIEYAGHKEPNSLFDRLDEFQTYIDKAKPIPTHYDDTQTAEEHAIVVRESNPLTRLGHNKSVWPTLLGPDGKPIPKP
jgi:hypothetical protein